MRKSARKLGAEINRFTRVLALNQRPDVSWDVVTDKGTIHAEHVVNCGGLWAREIGRMVGLELPVLAMEHHYIVTEAIPELAGLDREIVNTTDYSGEIYVRQEGKGALLGTYERELRRLGAGAHARRFRHAAAARRFRPDRARARGRLRAFSGRRAGPASRRRSTARSPSRRTAIRWSARCAGLPNFWVACAVMAGFSQGGGIGLVLSRWMAEGDPGRRRAGHGRGALRRFRDAEIHQPQGARELPPPLPPGLPERGTAGSAAVPAHRRSTTGCVEAGAVMGANFGLEHALWFAPPGVEPHGDADLPPLRSLRACAAPSARRCATAVGIYETSNYGKYEIAGRGARAWLDRVLACRIPKPGRMALAPMLNDAGRIIGDLTIACLAADRFMLTGSGFAEEFHMRWFCGQRTRRPMSRSAACARP